MTQLFVTDLDGTLFGADSLVSDESVEIISKLPKDKLFTIATARTPATVDLKLPSAIGPHIPAIVITGAALWHRDTSRYSNVKVMDSQAARIAEEVILSCGMAPFTYTIDEMQGMLYAYGRIPEGRHRLTPLTPAEKAFVDERRDLPLKHMYLYDNPGLHPSLLVFGIGHKEAVERAAALVKERIECAVSVYGDVFNPEKGFIEVFAPGVSKGAAVKELKQSLGADHLTVFGDSHNDIAMLKEADTAVVVANASEEVRAVADIVIGPNTESSVAHYIENN